MPLLGALKVVAAEVEHPGRGASRRRGSASVYFMAIPCGRAGCSKAVLKSRSKRVSRVRASGVVADHPDLAISIEVDPPEVILVEEVVGHHQSCVVVGQVDVVGAGANAQAHDRELLEGLGGIGP